MPQRSRIRAAIAAVRAFLAVALRDAAGLAGVALVSYGAWLAYEPAGFVVAGSLLLLICWASARGAA